MSQSVKNWILLLFLSMVWGSSFILMKRGMFALDGTVVFSDVQVAALRMFLASIVLFPFALLKIRKVARLDLVFVFAVGLFGNFLPAFLFTYAETGLPSSVTGMLNSCTPIFALLLGFFAFGNRLNLLQIVGVIVGTLGIILLSALAKDAGHSDLSWWHIFAVVIATLCYAISLNVIKFKLSHYSGVEITSVAFLLILPLSTPLVFGTDVIQVLKNDHHALTSFTSILILSVIGTAFAVYLFNVLIANSSLIFSSSVTYLIPVFAVVIGVLDGEKIGFLQLLAVVVILAGVFISNVLGKKNEKKLR